MQIYREEVELVEKTIKMKIEVEAEVLIELEDFARDESELADLIMNNFSLNGLVQDYQNWIITEIEID